ncbi:hypothetical protein Pla123a_48530 [Posidoniimonas polymericola]|uniref:Transglycosylase associated protein n=1 Tax=Posidoniimonas polymericola TaxID=2528002 RepID=A0A5C5XWD5_9BACT|nr:GlsB/YeaQ/YmgE family stress response membrane protein [Posidoniimonas polymericola]TWT65942.1 hypothetical protein Pla123a_48530 [Posidoniimonas polymericola]
MGLIWACIVWAVFGLIAGAIARLLVPGRQAMGTLATMVLGIIGSFVGGFIGYMFAGGELVQASGFIMSVIGAVIALLISIYAGKRNATV